MWERLQGSPTKTALSLATAACSFWLGVGSCMAGDKIDFSVPANPAIGQKPDREAPDTDSDPAKFSLRMPSGVGRRYQIHPIVTTVIFPSNDKHGLRAWDAGSKPSDLQDETDSFDADANQRAGGAFTNMVGESSEWSPGASSSASSRGQSLAGFSPQNTSEFSTQREATHAAAAAAARSGMESSSGWQNQASTPLEVSHVNGGSDDGTISAWGRSVATRELSYSDRVREQYRSTYTAGAMNLAAGTESPQPEAAALSTSETSPSSDLSATAQPWDDSSASPKSAEVYGNTISGALRAGYHPAALDTPRAKIQTATRTPFPNQPAFGTPSAPTHPAILPFPKKPGSLFQ